MCRRLTVRSGSLVSVICVSCIIILSTGKLVAVSAERLVVSAVSIVLLTGILLSRVSVLISAGSLVAGTVSIVLLTGVLLSRVSVLISAESLVAGAVSIVLLTGILRRLLILSGTLFVIVVHVAGVLRRRLLICILILRLRCCFLIHVVARRLLGSRVVRVIIIHIVIFVHDDEFLSWLQNDLHYIPIVN